MSSKGYLAKHEGSTLSTKRAVQRRMLAVARRDVVQGPVLRPSWLDLAVSHFLISEAECFGALAFACWAGRGPSCPRCPCKLSRYMAHYRRWECKGCRRQYSATSGTIFRGSRKLEVWISALWIIVNSPSPLSVSEVSRRLGVTPKTGRQVMSYLEHALRISEKEPIPDAAAVDTRASR